MTYKEPTNSLTGKSDRHTSAALKSIMGLTKATIIEPEEEIDVEEASF